MISFYIYELQHFKKSVFNTKKGASTLPMYYFCKQSRTLIPTYQITCGGRSLQEREAQES